MTSIAALWRDTWSVHGGTVLWWSWAESAEVKTWAADTYRKDMVLTNHQPEWMAQKQSSNCWPAICVVNSKFSMRLLVAPTQVERSLIPLWPFFPSQTFVAAMLKQLLTCPCYNLPNLLSQKTLKLKIKPWNLESLHLFVTLWMLTESADPNKSCQVLHCDTLKMPNSIFYTDSPR